MGRSARVSRRTVAGWQEVEQLIELIKEGVGAPARDNPFRGSVVDVLDDDKIPNASAMPAETVAEVRRHYEVDQVSSLC